MNKIFATFMMLCLFAACALAGQQPALATGDAFAAMSPYVGKTCSSYVGSVKVSSTFTRGPDGGVLVEHVSSGNPAGQGHLLPLKPAGNGAFTFVTIVNHSQTMVPVDSDRIKWLTDFMGQGSVMMSCKPTEK